MEYTAGENPRPSARQPGNEIPLSVSTAVGFLVLGNQFQALSKHTVSQKQVQGEDRLIDPRYTKLKRLQTAKRAEDQGNLLNEGNFENIVPPDFVQLAFFQHSLSISQADFEVTLYWKF